MPAMTIPRPRRSIGGAGARRKGHQWERDVVRLFAAIFGAGVRRGLQYRDGAECPDVVGVPGWWIECKKGRRPNPLGALRQAIEAARGSGLRPVAICREDGREPTATLRLADFIALLRPDRESSGSRSSRSATPRVAGRATTGIQARPTEEDGRLP